MFAARHNTRYHRRARTSERATPRYFDIPPMINLCAAVFGRIIRARARAWHHNASRERERLCANANAPPRIPRPLRRILLRILRISSTQLDGPVRFYFATRTFVRFARKVTIRITKKTVKLLIHVYKICEGKRQQLADNLNQTYITYRRLNKHCQ